MIVAGIANAVRLARWAGDRTFRDPLVLVLHAAFLFVPLGFVLAGTAAIFPDYVPVAAGIHAFGVGAIGSMTLAVMARATLGHTGYELRSSPAMSAMFVGMLAAGVIRIFAAFFPASAALLHGSACLWSLSFLAYVALFGGKLLKPRRRN